MSWMETGDPTPTLMEMTPWGQDYGNTDPHYQQYHQDLNAAMYGWRPGGKMQQPPMGAMTQMPPGWMPQTADQYGQAVGARVPPSFWARCCYPACAISGYEHGDPTLGIFEGRALLALILQLLCCVGCAVSLCCWQPDPENIKGDGTQRTVEQKCLAGFCVGFLAISFWESGDFCCGPDGNCTWCTEEAVKGCMCHFLPNFFSLPPMDCCYVTCMWEPDSQFFRRSLGNHGGGAAVVGAPVQTGPGNPPLRQVACGAPVPAVVGQVGAPVQTAAAGNPPLWQVAGPPPVPAAVVGQVIFAQPAVVGQPPAAAQQYGGGGYGMATGSHY